jgi:hypothetical protein
MARSCIIPDGEAHEQPTVQPQHIAALQCARRFDQLDWPVGGERLRDRDGLRSSRLDTGPGHHCDLIENDGHVFDKHGVGLGRLRRQRHDVAAQVGQRRFVRLMLHASAVHVDDTTLEVRQFAPADCVRHLPGDGNEHAELQGETSAAAIADPSTRLYENRVRR